jgi:hypothetical protein
MKKTTKSSGSRMLAKKAAAPKQLAKPKPRQALSRTDLLVILERMAESSERLARAAEQMAAAAAQISAATGTERSEPRVEVAGEVVDVMVVDEGEEE